MSYEAFRSAFWQTEAGLKYPLKTLVANPFAKRNQSHPLRKQRPDYYNQREIIYCSLLQPARNYLLPSNTASAKLSITIYYSQREIFYNNLLQPARNDLLQPITTSAKLSITIYYNQRESRQTPSARGSTSTLARKSNGNHNWPTNQKGEMAAIWSE